jgi:DNA-binding FrmR family transcriptional regulator
MHDRPDKAKLLNRLSRVEGHIRSIAKMVEDDRYCIEVLTQIRAALAKVESEMLKTHLSHCVEGAIAAPTNSASRRAN